MRFWHYFGIFTYLSLVANASGVEKPNIIFMMLDDLGKEWISTYGSQSIQTPNIDALASNGMKFNKAYSSPKCTPSRVTLLTGQYSYRHGWSSHWDVPRWSTLTPGKERVAFESKYYMTFARIMKRLGYVTAATGKWQINDFRVTPDAMQQHGFDESFMWTGAEGASGAHKVKSEKRYWNPYIHSSETMSSKTYAGEFGPELYANFVIDFLGKHPDKPKMVYYPLALPHTPFTTTPLEPSVSGNVGKHKAMVRYIDHIVGRLVNALDSLGLDSNTVLIFTTDNGTVGSMTGNLNGTSVRGGKDKELQSGISAPFIAYGPGIVPKGVVTNALVDFTDLFPTFADLGGANMDSLYHYYDLDGHSFAPLLRGSAQNSPRTWNLSMGRKAASMQDSGAIPPQHPYASRVIQNETYKVWVNENGNFSALYNINADPFESNNLINNPGAAGNQALSFFQTILDSMPGRDARFKYAGGIYAAPLDTVGDFPIKAVGKPSSLKKGVIVDAQVHLRKVGSGVWIQVLGKELKGAKLEIQIRDVQGKLQNFHRAYAQSNDSFSYLHKGQLSKGIHSIRVLLNDQEIPSHLYVQTK